MTGRSRIASLVLISALGCAGEPPGAPKLSVPREAAGASDTDGVRLPSPGDSQVPQPIFKEIAVRPGEPVTPAIALTSEKDGATGHIWIRLKISAGYHVYGKIERHSAYRALNVELQLPDGTTTSADWEYPAPEQSNGNSVYFDSVTLRRPLRFGRLKGPVSAVVRYQACNDEVCFPPAIAELTATLD